jgi:hypothetical protein
MPVSASIDRLQQATRPSEPVAYACANCGEVLTGPCAVEPGPDTAWHASCKGLPFRCGADGTYGGPARWRASCSIVMPMPLWCGYCGATGMSA